MTPEVEAMLRDYLGKDDARQRTLEGIANNVISLKQDMIRHEARDEERFRWIEKDLQKLSGDVDDSGKHDLEVLKEQRDSQKRRLEKVEGRQHKWLVVLVAAILGVLLSAFGSLLVERLHR